MSIACFISSSFSPRSSSVSHQHGHVAVHHSLLVEHNRSLPNSSRMMLSVRRNLNISNFYRIGAVGRDMEAIGIPTSVPVRVANELLQAGHRYLDVRTPEEFSAGHPSGSINIPYMYRLSSGMTKNPDFLKEVAQNFRKDDEIIVGCQSGKRSLMATSDLLSSGYTGITDIAGGYAAWIENGLPAET